MISVVQHCYDNPHAWCESVCISSILVNKKTCVVGVEEGGQGGG